MDQDNYKFRYDAYKNNTFDLDVVEETLQESKMSAYQYLRQFQLDSTGYKRFDFGMQEIYRNNKVNHNTTLVPRRWLFYLEHEFINVGKRLAYKRSKLYEKDLSFDDIISRPDLFDSTFLVFINGKLYTKGIKVLCKEDKTYLILYCKEKPSPDGFSIKEMREYIETNAHVSIYFIPNTGIKNVYTNAYRIRTLNNTTGIPSRTLNLPESINYENSLTYINKVGEIESLPTTTDITDSGMYVNSDDVDNIIKNNPNNTAVNIQLIPLRNLLMKIDIPAGDTWFEIPMQDYPVAIENCMVFDNEGMFVHEAKIKHYYPNVYNIEGIENPVQLSVYVFYFENNVDKLKHLDMLFSYHKYVPYYMDKYRDGSIPELVKEFDPPQVDYSIKNFMKYEEYNDHFRYKIAKMKEFIRADVNNFRRYLRNLGLGNNYYYVDVSKIDLSTRKRTNNSDTGLPLKEFDEEMYMFVFRNDFRGMYDKLLIHVDGLRYETLELFKAEMLDYLYIPCRLINENSILEVEKLTDVMREYEFSSPRKTDIINIDIGEYAVRNKTLYNDLFIVDKKTREYLDPSSYQIILPIKLQVDDKETDIVLDYIISESNNCYYYLKGLEEGILKLSKEDDVDDDRQAFYLRAQDDENDEVYQFDIDYDENIVFSQINDHANIINKVRSSDNANVVYEFNVVDGVAQINIITTDLVNAGANSRGIVAYGGLDIIDLGEVFIRCAQHVKVRITDEIYLGRELILMIKKNFKIESLEVQESKDVLDGITFKTASKNDRRYFRVYRNGRLVPRHVGAIRFPIDYDYSEMEVYPGFKREPNDEIMVECMPYMMTQTCYMERIPKDKVVDLTGMIDKPFDFKWYDIYLNGRKLIKKDVEIISANKIKIMNAKSVRWLEIIENSRDKEYFGYKPVYDILDLLFDTNQEFADNVNNTIHIDDLEDPVVEDIISLLDYILREFYNWLKDNFGLINPDLLQISRYNVVAFKELLSEDEPFELNPDKYGKDGCDLYLTVNPDDED